MVFSVSGKRICNPNTAIEQARIETERLTLKQRAFRRSVAEHRNTKREFEHRMRAFREVCTKAWDVVIEGDQSKLQELRRALELTDNLWTGYAGCTRDIPMSAEQDIQ